MKRYEYRQKFAVIGDLSEEKKNVNVSILVEEEGLSKQQVMNLFHTLAGGYVRFIAEEMGVYDRFEELQPFGDIEGDDISEKKI